MANGRARIVLINDDDAFLDLMEVLLEEDGRYDVRTCRQWEQAHAFVKEQRPDLVILDIVIGPGEERGWTLLSMLTLDPATLPIPLVVCSAAIDSLRDHGEFLDEHGIRVLHKPFDLDRLHAAIQAMLGGRAT
jgi:two-component system response regulator RpaA